MFINKGIQELLSQTGGDAGIDCEGELGTTHSCLCSAGVDTEEMIEQRDHCGIVTNDYDATLLAC